MNLLDDTIITEIMKFTEVALNVFGKGLVIDWIMKGPVWWDIRTFDIKPRRRVLFVRVPIRPSPIICVISSTIINYIFDSLTFINFF